MMAPNSKFKIQTFEFLNFAVTRGSSRRAEGELGEFVAKGSEWAILATVTTDVTL